MSPLSVTPEQPKVADYYVLKLAFTLSIVLVALREVTITFDSPTLTYMDIYNAVYLLWGNDPSVWIDMVVFGHSLYHFWNVLKALPRPGRADRLRGWGWKKVPHIGEETTVPALEDGSGMKAITYGHLFSVRQEERKGGSRDEAIFEVCEHLLTSIHVNMPPGMTKYMDLFTHCQAVHHIVGADVLSNIQKNSISVEDCEFVFIYKPLYINNGR